MNQHVRVLLLNLVAFGAVGGIPRITQHICKALGDKAEPASVDIFTAYDRPDQSDPRYLGAGIGYRAASSASRTHYIRTVLSHSMRHTYDLCLVTHVNLAPVALLLQLLRRVRHYAIVVYGIDAWYRLPLLRRYALNTADGVISISKFTVKEMQANNGQGSRHRQISVVPLCLDPYWGAEAADTAHQAADITLPPGQTLLTVSRLIKAESYKGHRQVIRALPQVADVCSDVKYVIVGDGDLRPELMSLANQLGVSDRVFCVGQRVGPALTTYYSNADVFVMPSKKEGFGLVYLEAMYHRLPVIASNCDAAQEVVRDGETGRLVDPDNIDELAQTLIDLLRNEDVRRRMGEKGHQCVVRDYTFDRFEANMWSALQKLAP